MFVYSSSVFLLSQQTSGILLLEVSDDEMFCFNNHIISNFGCKDILCLLCRQSTYHRNGENRFRNDGNGFRKNEKHSGTISGRHEKLMDETMAANSVAYATFIEQDISHVHKPIV